MKFWPFRFRREESNTAPVDIDDDVQFHEDIRYLESLADTVLDDTRLARIEISDDIYADYVARPLHEMASRPIESEAFWRDWTWDDHAAAQLSLWRMDRDMADGPGHGGVHGRDGVSLADDMRAEEQSLVNELARELSLGIPGAESWEIAELACGLIKSGWTKAETP